MKKYEHLLLLQLKMLEVEEVVEDDDVNQQNENAVDVYVLNG
jgi:hypothetical protein